MKIEDCPLNYLFRIYLMSSYLYYKENKIKISDEMYDYICKILHEHYDAFDNQHKYLVKREDFAAGTGYALTYPNMVKYGALSWYKSEDFNLEM